MFSPDDSRYMARALRLAERGLWTTSPNPRVGCVIVGGGEVIGEGWHERAGEPHAEVLALRAAGDAARGATAYVTLEPCAHHGRTPPCAEALVAAGIARVVAAMEDPNPLVAGQGMAGLRAAGIVAEVGLMAAAASELNRGFISRMTRGRPWVRAKIAGSLDGRSALAGGESRWITGAAARRDGHRWRARACAILTGSGTVTADDPQLSVREVETTRQPQRFIVDSQLRCAPAARIFSGGETAVATLAASVGLPVAAALRSAGVETIALPAHDERVDLPALLDELGRRGVNELHVEAGPRLNGALLKQGLIDEVVLYLAPSLIGDTGRGLFALPELASLADRAQLKVIDLRQIGSDFRILARFE